MADIKLYGSFIAEKLSKVRFVQEKYKLVDTFVSGGWGLSTNAINLWQLTKDEFSMDDDDGDYVPKSIAKVAVDGDVTGLEFLNADTIVCSTSSTNGISLLHSDRLRPILSIQHYLFSAQVLFINLNNQVSQNNLTVKNQVGNLHKYPCNDAPAVCTGLSVHDLNIATVGEDGRQGTYHFSHTKFDADCIPLILQRQHSIELRSCNQNVQKYRQLRHHMRFVREPQRGIYANIFLFIDS